MRLDVGLGGNGVLTETAPYSRTYYPLLPACARTTGKLPDGRGWQPQCGAIRRGGDSDDSDSKNDSLKPATLVLFVDIDSLSRFGARASTQIDSDIVAMRYKAVITYYR